MRETIAVRRLLLGLRYAVLAGVLIAAVGIAGHVAGDTPLGGTWLTTTLCPTAYVILAHPRSVTARLRNGLIGHAVGIAAGLAALAVFGLWGTASVAETHAESLPQVGAQAAAVAVTLLVLGLAVVLAAAPLLARLPGERHDTAGDDARETPMG